MFWLTAGALILASGVALFLGLWRGRDLVSAEPRSDIAVYRDQLAEVARDAARGVIAPDEAERLRIEISRRLLEAHKPGTTARPGRGPGLGLTLVLVAALLGGAVWVYAGWLGAPGYPDMPLSARIAAAESARATRKGQAEMEAAQPALPAPPAADAEFMALMDKLRAAVTARPDDVRGLDLLAQNEARLGRYPAAWAAQAALIKAKGEAATAEDYAVQAEMMIYATGGYVSPEAEAALKEALIRDRMNGSARFYSGLMLLQNGRPDLAFPIWQALLETTPPDAPWVAPIRQDIEQVAQLAGVRYQLPDGLKGPDAAAMQAAAGMEAGDRQAMIAGMVEQLNERLAAEGGSVEEWARLITSLGVLGQTDRARAIYAEAQGKFAGRADDLAALRAAADQAGVAP